MTFDDQLRRAFDTLSDRLRDEVNRQIQAAMDELAASAQAERTSAIEAAVSSARTEREAALEAAVASARAEREAAVAAAVASARAEREAAIDAAATSARAERETAIEAAVASARAERETAVEAAVASARTERDSAVDAALASARAERDHAVDAALAAAVPLPHLMVDEPVVIRTEALVPVAAGVRAMSQANTLTGVLQALMTAAGASGAMANIWLVRGHQLEPWRQNGASAPLSIGIDADNPIAEVLRSKAPAARDEMAASPLMLAGDVVAVLVTASHQPPAPSPDALDVLALHASRSLEAIIAFKTARALTRQSDDTAAASTPATSGTDGVSAEEHASARRYAKLLVSEIKLYHEADVVSGRRDRDLATRLGGEIAHARVMYEQRVPPHVRQHADYFHDELLRTLADGDASLLEVRT
jgi:hypothetical protein